MRKHISSSLSALLGLALLSMPRLTVGTALLPTFRMPRQRASKTYGAMPVNHAEVAAWNRAVVQRNIQRGKLHP